MDPEDLDMQAKTEEIIRRAGVRSQQIAEWNEPD